MGDHNVALKLSIPGVSDTSRLSLAEVIDKAVEAQVLYTTADNVVNSLAPHLHSIFAQVEHDVRSDSAYSSIHNDDVKVGEKVLDIMDGYCDKELQRIRGKGWEGNSLPRAAYTAMKSIRGALEHGGSLMKLTTVSQCKKFHADARKAAKKAAADQHDASHGNVNVNKTEGDTTVIGASMQSDEQYHAKIAEAIKKLDEAFKANPVQAEALAQSVVSKADNIVHHAMSRLAKGAANS